MTAAFYQGSVRHRRLRPKHHALTYKVFSLLVDPDNMPSSRYFSYNRRNILSVHDKDHGDGKTPISTWVRDQVAAAGLSDPVRIRMLFYPRLWGYAFNPLTVYYIDRLDGSPAAILYQVNNTFGQRHCYLFMLNGATEQDGVLRHSCDKEFYVSPFIPMEMTYHFRLTPPGEKLAIAIHETDAEGDFLFAAFTAEKRPFSDKELLRQVARHPLMTLKVIAGIHWEALKLWRKGAVFQSRPNPPQHPVRIINDATSK
jgi:DUF1365 family protein